MRQGFQKVKIQSFWGTWIGPWRLLFLMRFIFLHSSPQVFKER